MKKRLINFKLLLGVIFLSLAPAMLAQSTVVSGTIVDPGGNTWSGALVSAVFTATPGVPGPYNWDGGDYNPIPPGVFTDSGGNFSLTLPSNNAIYPSGSTWTFSVCPNATLQCAVVNVAAVGAGLNLEAQINALSAWPNGKVQPTTVAKVYNVSQAGTPPFSQGGMLYDTTNQLLDIYTSGGWVPFASVGGLPVVTNPSGNQTVTQPTGSSLNVNILNKVFYVSGFPTTATLNFGDGCLLQDGTSCSGTFYSQLDVANAAAADWIYTHGNACPGGSLGTNIAACAQAGAQLVLADDIYYAYHPVCGPSNVPVRTINQVQAKPSLYITGQGKAKSIIRAGATMEAVVYCNDSSLALQTELSEFSVDGGYYGLDTNPVVLTSVAVAGGVATYTGTVPTGAGSSLANKSYDFSGFSNAGNNATGLRVINSTTTTITVTNPSAVAETGASGHGAPEMANWGVELNGLVNSHIEHVDVLASGAIGIEELGKNNEDAAMFISDQFLYGIHPIPFSTVAQGVANMSADGGGDFHVGSLTLNNGGNFYCSITTVNCTAQVRFVGAGVIPCTTKPTATATVVNRVVTALTLTGAGVGCGSDVGISIEPLSTAQYMFYASDWVNSSAYDINVTGVTSVTTPSAGFTIAAGGNHIVHGHPQDTAIGYLDDGGVSYDHPEADTITDHAFDLNGDGDTITGMSSYWQAGSSYLPYSYDFFLGPASSNTGIVSKVCRIGGQSYGGYYEFVDSNGPDDFLTFAPAGTTVENNQYCGPITQTGNLTTGSITVAVANTAGFRQNYPITAPTGIVPGTIIAGIVPNTSITLSQPASNTTTQAMTMTGPLPRTSLGPVLASQVAVGSPATVIIETSPGNFSFRNKYTGIPGHVQLSGISLFDPVSLFQIFISSDTLSTNRSLTIPDGSGKFVLTGAANQFAAGLIQQFTNSTTYGFMLTPEALPTTIVRGGVSFNAATGRLVVADTASTQTPVAYTSDFNGVTVTGASCTVKTIVNGLITSATCP